MHFLGLEVARLIEGTVICCGGIYLCFSEDWEVSGCRLTSVDLKLNLGKNIWSIVWRWQEIDTGISDKLHSFAWENCWKFFWQWSWVGLL